MVVRTSLVKAGVLLALFATTTLADYYILDDTDPSITYNSPNPKSLYWALGETTNFMSSLNTTKDSFDFGRIYNKTM